MTVVSGQILSAGVAKKFNRFRWTTLLLGDGNFLVFVAGDLQRLCWLF